jgi:hypothetical protein
MKKYIILLSVIGLLGCEDKLVSQDYYYQHLDEARQEVTKCGANKDENSVNCSNARKALSKHALKVQDKDISDSL